MSQFPLALGQRNTFSQPVSVCRFQHSEEEPKEFALGATLVACSPCGCSVVPVRSFALQQRERWTSQANLPIIRAGDMFMYRVKAPA